MYLNNYTLEPITKIEGFERMVESDERFAIHHRLETHRWSRKQQKWVLRDEVIPSKVLKALGLYYNRPAFELIYMSSSEHSKLHSSFKKGITEETRKKLSAATKKQWEQRHLNGYTVSEETKKKMSENRKGIASWNKGKTGVQSHSEETRKKISEYQKTHDNAGRFGNRPSWNKGLNVSGMSGKHHSEETKKKISESNKTRKEEK